MTKTNLETMRALYEGISCLQVHDDPLSASVSSGVYFFFERGQSVTIEGHTFNRIVRVGKAQNSLFERISTHYLDTRRRSVFRRHLGSAILVASEARLNLVNEWYNKKGTALPEVEEDVGARLRSEFTYSLLPVDPRYDISNIERTLIALLTSHNNPLAIPSTWLGRQALNQRVRESGLWNVFHTKDKLPSELKLEMVMQCLRDAPRRSAGL